jgi:hypothetical protein
MTYPQTVRQLVYQHELVGQKGAEDLVSPGVLGALSACVAFSGCLIGLNQLGIMHDPPQSLSWARSEPFDNGVNMKEMMKTARGCA